MWPEQFMKFPLTGNIIKHSLFNIYNDHLFIKAKLFFKVFNKSTACVLVIPNSTSYIKKG